MIGFTENSRGRYKCNYCNHTTYKTWGGANNHVTGNHPVELERDRALDRVKYLERAKTELGRQLAEATKPTAKKEKEYWYVRNYGIEGIYCTTCKQVQTGVGIPVGQTIENTPHSCGNRTLLPVVEVK